MNRLLVSLLCGVLFSIGLVLSGMTNPEKVIGFLDIFGKWDPSLLFVMGSALFVNIISFRFILKQNPVFATNHQLPTKKNITWKLIVGSTMFGAGWGLVGICPGPGIVNLVVIDKNLAVFICSMISGMLLFKFYKSRCK